MKRTRLAAWRRTIRYMAARPKKGPRPAPGYEAEWAVVNEEEARGEAAFAASLSPSQRVAYGQKLSQQAV